MKDLIDRQAAIDAIEKAMREDGFRSSTGLIHKTTAYEIIRHLPSVQPKQKRGKWINGYCSECGKHAPFWAMASTYYKSSFCPNCGADMRGEQDG